MSNKKLEVSAPSPSNQIDYSKHLGVCQTKSGKWGAEIRHPITRASAWLGSHNTPKEANAFMKRKMEYQSLAVVHKTQDSGIQGVKILDPGKYESVSLGTCNSAADYENLYVREMLEFDSVFRNATVEETENTMNRKTCEAKFIDRTEMNCTESKLRVKEDVIAHSSKMRNQLSVDLAVAVGNTGIIRAKRLHGSGSIYQNKSGIQGVKILDPGKYEPVCLGTCNSAADYANVYAREMLEFDSIFTNATVDETEITLNRNRKMCKAKLIDRTEMNCAESKLCVKEDVIAHSLKMRNQLSEDLAVGNTDIAIRAKRLPGSGSIYRNESGMWRAQFSYRNSKVHVGNYRTYEEAEAATHKKRQQLHSVACVEAVGKEPANGELMCSDQNPEKQVSIISPYREEHLAEIVSNADVGIRVKRLPGSGSISKTKEGRWQARIYSGKSRVRVGIYSTYEEAEAAIQKKRQGIDVEMAAASKESVALIESINGVVGTYEILNTKRREFSSRKNAEKKCKQTIDAAEEDLQSNSGTITNCNAKLTEWKGDETAPATKSQDTECGDCSPNVEDIQVPEEPMNGELICNQEFDMSVINAYGQLVGEFSRLDDDLWLVESLDDAVEN